MQAIQILEIALVAVGIAACGVLIYVLFDVRRAAISTARFAEETRERLVPLLEKADVTVDAINAELLRIDAIVTQFEEVSDKVSSTTQAVQGAVNAPLEAVTAVGSGVRGAISTWRRSRKKTPQS